MRRSPVDWEPQACFTKMHTESITSKLSGQKNTMVLSFYKDRNETFSCQSTAPKCKLRHWGRSPHHPAKLREAWPRARNHFTHQPIFKGFEFEKWNKTNYPHKNRLMTNKNRLMTTWLTNKNRLMTNKNRLMTTWPLNKVRGYAPFPPIRHVFPLLCEYFS